MVARLFEVDEEGQYWDWRGHGYAGGVMVMHYTQGQYWDWA